MPEYSSLCASVELTVDFDPTNPAPLADQIRAVQHIAAEAVESELQRQLGEIGRTPAPTAPTAAQNGSQAPQNGSGRISRPSHPATVKTDRGTTIVLDDSPPKTGRAMWAWASGQEERHNVVGLKRFLKAYGEVHNHPAKFVEWSREEVDRRVPRAPLSNSTPLIETTTEAHGGAETDEDDDESC